MRKPPFHYGWVIVLTGNLTLLSCFGLARYAFGMLLPGMRESLGLAYDQMGYIGTANFSGYLASVALTPFLLKVFKPRMTVASGLLVIALGLGGMAQAGSFLPLLLYYALAGAGSGLVNIGTMVLVAHWFRREKRGQAAGLTVLGNGLGIIFSGFIIPWMDSSYGPDGWRASWLLLAVIILGVAVVSFFLLKNSPEEMGLEPVGRKEPVTETELKKGKGGQGRILVTLGILYMAFGATFMVYGTFIVTSMIEEYGLSQSRAGQFWSWVGFFSLFSGVLFGGLSDRIGRKGGLLAVFAVQTMAYLLAGAGWGLPALLTSVFFYGIAAWSIPAIMSAAAADYLGVARAAAGFSLITFFFAAGQTLGPAMAGILAEQAGSFFPAFFISAAVTGGAALFTLTLPRPSGD